jgi:hypothetical protein
MTAQQSPDRLQEAIETLREVGGKVDKLAETSAKLARDGRRNRLLVFICIGFGVIVAAVVAGVAVALIGVDRNDATISDVHSTEVGGCVAGNQTRGAQIGLWKYIYDLSDVSKYPKAIQRKDNELIAHVEQVFAPRHCTNLYRLP